MATRDEILRFVVKTEGSESVRAMAKDVDAVAEAAAAGDPKAKELVDELERLNQVGKAASSLERLGSKLEQTGSALDSAKQNLDQLNKEFGETGPKTKQAADAIAKAEREVAKLAREEISLASAVARATANIKKHGVDVNNLGAAQADVAAGAQRAAAGVTSYASAAKESAAASDKAAAGASKAGKAFDSMRNGINNAVRSLLQVTGIAGAVSAALSAIGVGRLFGGAIDSATEFESKLSSIRAVTGASSEQLARMKKAAEDATKTTKFSASQAADALGELARASGDADAAIAQLAPTLNLAQAAGIGTSEAALILTTTLTQFGLGADQATRAADLFSREANSTNDTVEKLGLAMSYVAPLARQLGLSLEETTAIIGAMAQEGFRGERAGTALRNVFSALLDPSSKFREELRGLGINSKNFTEIITQLAAAGDKGKRALLALDAEATPAIQALVTSGGANIKRLLGDFENVNGEVERTARTMGDNFGGATARLSSAFDQLRRALIEPILDPLKVQFDDVANRIRAFIQTAEFDRIIESVKRFAIDATDALIALGRGVDYNELSNRIREFTRDASRFFTDLKENVQGVLSAISIASGTISTIFNAIQTVILGAATAVTGAMSIFVRSIRAAVEAMSALPGGAEQFRGVAERLTEVIGGLDAVATEFAKRTAKNAGETADAFNGLSAAVDDAGKKSESAAPKIESVTTAAQKSSGEVTKYADSLGVVPDYAAKAGESSASLAQTLERLPFVTQAAASSVGDLQDKLSDKQKWAAAEVELQRLSSQLAELSRSGKSNTDEFRAVFAAWEQAARKARELKDAAAGPGPELEKLTQAYKNLGVASQQDLTKAATIAKEDFETIRAAAGSTTEGINKTREAFIAYAQKAIEAVAASDAATKAQTESQLRNLAAQVGASKQLEEVLGKQKAVGQEAETTGQKTVRAGESGAKAMQQTAAAADDAKESIKEAGDTAQAVSVSFEGIGRASFKAIADLYSQVLARKGSVRDLQFEIEKATDRLRGQEAAAASLTQTFSNMDDAAARAFINQAGGAQRAIQSLQSMAAAARAGEGAFDELDQSRLDGVASAADAAAAKVAEITQQALQARDALRGMADSAQDEIDRLRGNEEAILERQHQQRLEQIQREAEFAGQAGSAEAQRAIAKENELHALRMANIAKEKAERERGGGGGGSSPPAAPATPAPRPNTSGGGGSINNTFNFNGLVLTGTQDQVADQLARITAPALSRLSRRGGG